MGAPVVKELYHYPMNPLPLSTITFYAGIYNNSTEIEEVRLMAQECMDGLSFIESQNISMNYMYSCCMDFYEAEVNLIHEDATQVKYHLEIKSNGTWHQYEQNVISLSIPDKKETGNIVVNTTSGFDLPLIFLSMLVAIWHVRIKQKIK